MKAPDGARLLLEQRYLAGREALFSHMAATWREVQEAVQLLAERGGSKASTASVRTQAASLAAGIVATARAANLALVGELGGAAGGK